jgi:hypothetical protein
MANRKGGIEVMHLNQGKVSYINASLEIMFHAHGEIRVNDWWQQVRTPRRLISCSRPCRFVSEAEPFFEKRSQG